ncbi:hypothetical protein H9P43_000319 [Blastocladiella emersonii ATCC 22665]|nr:hypothetical protein H9P43_000319 [Blastocladiella emersonii ATCC 22665]
MNHDNPAQDMHQAPAPTAATHLEMHVAAHHEPAPVAPQHAHRVFPDPAVTDCNMYKAATRSAVTGYRDGGAFRRVLEAACSTLDTDDDGSPLPPDVRMHGLQLLAHAASTDAICAAEPDMDGVPVPTATAVAAGESFIVNAEARMLALKRGKNKQLFADVVHVSHLLTTSPADRNAWPVDVPGTVAAITRLVNLPPSIKFQPEMLAIFAYFVELSRTHETLHAAGIVVSLSKHSYMQLYTKLASGCTWAVQARAATATEPPNQLLRRALQLQFKVDGNTAVRALREVSFAAMIGQSMLNAMAKMIRMCYKLAIAHPQVPAHKRMSVLYLLDGDNCLATAAELDALNQPRNTVHIYAVARSFDGWAKALAKPRSSITPHPLEFETKKTANAHVQEHLSSVRADMCARPWPLFVVLVSKDKSFDVMTRIAHKHLGLVGDGDGCNGEGIDPGCWLVDVHTVQEAAALAAWTEMCATAGGVRAGAAAPAAGSQQQLAPTTE